MKSRQLLAVLLLAGTVIAAISAAPGLLENIAQACSQPNCE